MEIRESNKYLSSYFDSAKDLTGVEVGVREGENAAEILAVLGSRLKTLYLVDPYIPYGPDEVSCPAEKDMMKPAHMDSVMRKALRRFEGLNKIQFYRMKSTEAARIFQEKNILFDFVYIDAMHTQWAVEEDIDAWLPLVKPGGILFGHDYNFDSVKAAVEKKLQGSYFVLKDNVNWVHIKPSSP